MGTIVTLEPLTVSFFIRDIVSATDTFDRMIWYRSRSGDKGLYDLATAGAVGPATLTGRLVGPHSLNGKTLKFTINGTINVSVPFPGADPYTTTAAAAAINGATLAVIASADSDDRLLLTTVATGSGASIEIKSSDAAGYLGFDAGDASVGLDANLTLAVGTHQYFYTDQNSAESFFYKIQLYNSTTFQVSDLSVPIPADQIPIIPYSNTLVASIRLVDMAGRPIAGRRVTLANVFTPNVVLGHGIFRHYLTLDTDQNGYAETRLLRGMDVDVSVDGSGFVRRIRVPTLGDVIDLLDPSLVVSDEFGIQTPQIDFAIRVS